MHRKRHTVLCHCPEWKAVAARYYEKNQDNHDFGVFSLTYGRHQELLAYPDVVFSRDKDNEPDSEAAEHVWEEDERFADHKHPAQVELEHRGHPDEQQHGQEAHVRQAAGRQEEAGRVVPHWLANKHGEG